MRDTTHELIRRLGECDFKGMRAGGGGRDEDVITCKRENVSFVAYVGDGSIKVWQQRTNELVYEGSSVDECVTHVDDMLCNMRGGV